MSRSVRRSRAAWAAGILLSMLVGVMPAGASSPAVAVTPESAPVAAQASPESESPSVVHGQSRGPSLQVRMPASVEEGEAVTLELIALGARDLAGYELLLAYDAAAAEFAGTEGIRDAFAGTGRHVAPLGPVETDVGVWLGMYSCPFRDCVTAKGDRKPDGASGDVSLGRVRLLPLLSGQLDVRIAAARFVDSRGRATELSVPDGPLSVTVARGAGRVFAAPNPSPRLGNGRIDQARDADVTGDGRIDHSDVMEVAIEWRLARADASPCDGGPQGDTTGDSCIDVGDVQHVAAAITAESVRSNPVATGEEQYLAAVGAALVSLDATAVTAGTFTVTSTGDQADSNAGDGICSTSSGCTLRAAITEANLRPGPDNIAFNISGTGARRITIGSRLPTINDLSGPTTIDGYTQPGATPNSDPLVHNGVLRIEVRGSSGSLDGMFITSPDNVVRGLAMFNMRLIIAIQGAAGRNNTIVGNYLGTDAAGTFVSPYVSGAQAVLMDQGAAFNNVGAPTLAGRNVISGNANNGIRTWHDYSDHNRIVNNLIGLGRNGQPVRNGAHGIDINAGSSYTVVGGTGPLERNVISGNFGEGIEFSHGSMTTGNRALGNYVGTDVHGGGSAAAGYGNGLHGVHVEDGATNSLVANNVIGNNGFAANAPGAGVAILGRFTAGIRLRDNRIGLGPAGQSIPNDEFGVTVYFNAAWNDIGPNNVITNSPIGIEINSHPNKYNTITRNSIYGNSVLGINLQGGTLVSLNDGNADSDDGANGMLNFPVLSAASATAVSGRACPGCAVEIFVSERNSGDAGAGDYGQGRTFVGAGIAGSDGNFSVGVSGVPGGAHVTSTATDALGNTSEFSLNLAVPTGTPGTPGGPPPTGDPSIIASDSFSRTATDTWGRANLGGAYAYLYCTVHHFDVNGSAGTVVAPAPGTSETCPYQSGVAVTTQRGAYLTDVSALDVDMTVRVRTNKAAGGDNQNVFLAARRWRGNTEYRGQARLTPTGQVWLQASKAISGQATFLGTNTRAQGATHAANQDIWVRMQVTGTGPTTIRLKAWNAGSTEPSSWTYQVTDGEPELQQAGGVGVMATLSGGSNVGDVIFSFDDLLVREVGAAPPPPSADFTASQTSGTLSVSFADTSSGSPTTWSWSFGDGGSSNQQNPSHTYAAAGEYDVTLTATNAGGSNSVVKKVTVAPLPPPPAPTADFSWSQTPETLSVSFTDSSAGSPTAWTWNFGDGKSSTQQNPTHAYAAAGDYQVRLTASNAGGSTTRTKTVTVEPLPATISVAADTFSRSRTDTWGSAETGGAYSYLGSLADFDVNGSAGSMRIPSAGNTRAVFLNSVSALDLDLSFSVSLDKLPAAGSGVYVYGAGRTVGTNAAYWAKLRLLPGGQVRVSASRLVSGAETALTGEFILPGAAYVAGDVLRVRTTMTGTSPTTIRIRVWRASEPEPSTWLVQATDTTSALQVAGGIGLRSYAASSSTDPPYVLTYDNLLVTTPGAASQAPGAAFMWSQAADSLSVTFTDTSIGQATAWSWDFGDGSTSSDQNPSHTYAAAQDYQVTLTAANEVGSGTHTELVSVLPRHVEAPTAGYAALQMPGTLDVRFADRSTGQPAAWSWDFGDGASASGQNATHSFTSPGTYTVTLTAQSSAGSHTYSDSVTVAEIDNAPAAPAGLDAKAGTDNVQVSWAASTEADVIGYNVYRDAVPAAAAVVFTGAGDIAACEGLGDEATASLLDAIPGWVYTTGDNVYPDGTAEEFRRCFHPSWGRHWERTWPVAGNHEYHVSGAPGYYGYFGVSAGDPTKGYYSFSLGAWRIFVLNTECSRVGGCGVGSPQEQWLRAELARSTNSCTLALWHRPLFTSSSGHAPDASARPLFQALYDFNADLVLVGHEHNYERFAPQDPIGVLNTSRGIRQIVVGTGGRSHYGFGTPQPNSQVRNADTFGVLKLTLNAASYGWQFIPETGKTFTDSGTTACHDARGPLVEGEPLTQAPLGATSFTDTSAAAGIEHRYVVTAVDRAGNESLPSAAKWATASGPPPVADFTPSQTAGTLSVSFTDTSTGGPTSWSWTFGDGSSSTAQNPSHTYAQGGDYDVTLTVSSSAGTDSTTKSVTVVPLPPPPAPTANFSWSQSSGSLSITFADSSTGSPTSWSWAFGDGSTSTQRNPSHEYGVAGDYQVTLTVTNSGGSDTHSDTVTVSPLPSLTVFAHDAFTRIGVDTWGTAETGGAYRYVGSAGDFDTDGSSGTIRLAAGATRVAFLPDVAARDVELDFTFALAALPQSGNGVYVYGITRQSASGAQYWAKVRVQPNGQVRVSIARLISNSETQLTGEVLLSGARYAAGDVLRLKARVTGTSPTTVEVKVWRNLDAEPAAWTVAASDSAADLQVAGATGIRVYSSSKSGATPIVVSIDDFTLRSVVH